MKEIEQLDLQDTAAFRKLLGQLKLTPEELCERLDISLKTATNWLEGTSAPVSELRKVILRQLNEDVNN